MSFDHQIHENLSRKTTAELQSIMDARDGSELSDEAFAAAERILAERENGIATEPVPMDSREPTAWQRHFDKQSRIDIDDTAQADTARWIARALSIPIILLFLVSLYQQLFDRTQGRLSDAGVIVVILTIGAGYVIAWWREDSGGVLVVAGVSWSLAGALSCDDPFRGYETMLGCFVTACLVVPGLLFLVSWGLRGSSTPLPPAPRIHRGSGSTARWQWITRATSLIALTYAMWLLVMVNLHRDTYDPPTSTGLSAPLALAILGGIAGWKYPRNASVLMALSAVGFYFVLLMSGLMRGNSDRNVSFAALAMPLAVAGLFQLVSATRRPPAFEC